MVMGRTDPELIKCLIETTAVWSTLFLLNVSTALKGTHNYILIYWLLTAIGIMFYLQAFRT